MAIFDLYPGRNRQDIILRMQHEIKQIPLIRELMKQENDTEIAEAECNFRAYLELAQQIFTRLESEAEKNT